MKFAWIVVAFVLAFTPSWAAGQPNKITLNSLVPPNQQRAMGLHKLTRAERNRLSQHMLMLMDVAYKKGQLDVQAVAQVRRKPVAPRVPAGQVYVGGAGGHWVKNNINSGSFIVLEDNSLWQIDPLSRLDATLWLAMSGIRVVQSNRGSPGYNYLLINTSGGESAHAKFIGKQ